MKEIEERRKKLIDHKHYVMRNRERSQHVFKRNQHFELQKLKQEKLDRKIIIK